MSDKPHSLVGKTINDIKLQDDNEAILFRVAEGDVIATCYAECCSQTWIEHVSLPARGFPAKVISVEHLEMPDLGQPDSGAIEYYGFKIVTDRGEILIDYRNESNGYYGGSLDWPEDRDYYAEAFADRRNWVEVKP